MKSQILKTLTLVLFVAALFTSCSIENQDRRGRYRYDRHRDRDRHGKYDRYHDRDYNNRYNNY